MKSASVCHLVIALFAALEMAACGGSQGTTTTLPKSVPNPVPSITGFSPGFVMAGAVAQNVTVNGANFVAGSTATFDGAAHPATFGNSSQLAVSLSAADLASAGCYDLTVTNPAPGGGTSNSASLAVRDPAGSIYVLDTDNHRVQVFDSQDNYVSQFSHSFDLPIGIAVDCNRDVYVFDGGAHCVVDKFDSNGTFLLQFGQCAVSGPGPGILDNAGMVDSDGAGNVWVTSPDYYYLQKFDSSGNFLTIVCMGNAGVNNCPQMTPMNVQPQGIALDAVGNAYVANVDPITGPNVIKLDSTGKYLAAIGSPGSNDGQFTNSTSLELAFDADGNLYVTDSGNNRVQKFDSTGKYVSQFGSKGTGNGQFSQPTGIAFDGHGNIYVTDVGNNRIEEFDGSGNYLAQFGSFGSGNGQFFAPYGIILGANYAIGKCLPQGAACYGNGPNQCCLAPRGHHAYCSNPTGWGTCVES